MSEKQKLSPIEITLNVVSGKWKPLIIYFLLRHDVLRFGELQCAIPVATRRMLTKHLRELEAHGIIHREVYAEVPPRVEYSLTDFGRTLQPVLDMMVEWGFRYLEQHPEIELSTPEDMYAE